MSSTYQVSMNNEREIQLNRILSQRKDLRNIGSTEAVKVLLFERMDALAPVEIKAAETPVKSGEKK